MELRELPSVDRLAGRLREVLEPRKLPEALLISLARHAVDEARAALLTGDSDVDPLAAARSEAERLAALRPTRVVNATGVVLHTNLGRAPIERNAVAEAEAIAAGYTNVEFDFGAGSRGRRGGYVVELLQVLTGAEAGLAVNNNAGALLLALAALAGERGAVAVSRGELIEIGGSFRLPDLMRASGARLVEVGTTNRTRLADYAAVIDEVDAVLKVHPSNYRIEGFAEEVGYAALAELALAHGVPMIADIGSGLLDTRTPWLDGPPPDWLEGEPGVRQTLEDGASVVLFSGDKLLGGPQAGIAVGTQEAVGRMAVHPMARALRTDGTTQGLLGATLEAYASGSAAALPFWRMVALDAAQLRPRHEAVLEAAGIDGEVVVAESVPGAGSVPGRTIPSPAIRLAGRSDAAWKALVDHDPPVIGRRRGDALFVDLRAVEPEDDDVVAAALATLT
jgi:L-seryl-tRNA(Ser) seleniumtransferase